VMRKMEIFLKKSRDDSVVLRARIKAKWRHLTKSEAGVGIVMETVNIQAKKHYLIEWADGVVEYHRPEVVEVWEEEKLEKEK